MIYVDYVVLDLKHQGKGIATKFLPVFEKHVMKQGIRKIYGTVDEENDEALSLFKRWGFEVKGKIASSIIIEKQLSPSHSSTSSTSRQGKKVAPELPVRRIKSAPALGFRN
jgi:hypothetical protein